MMHDNAELRFWKNKKVLITGHTGFKGAWLSLWLDQLGAEVIGYALAPESSDSLFKSAHLDSRIHHYIADINDASTLQQVLHEHEPEIIFHLAAQALVINSYQDPIHTFNTNVMGTVQLLETARHCSSVQSVIVITTDKCYANQEWHWGYRETDQLGGYDPYSSSKAMAELAASCFRQSMYESAGIGLATARAGNVIGGGDFSAYRIIPDIVTAISKHEEVVLRHPQAIRPWQHVLDVLWGYMLLAMRLNQEPSKFSTAFNFAPYQPGDDYTVENITRRFIESIQKGSYRIDTDTAKNHESKILRLDPSKAHLQLGWSPQWDVHQTIQQTANWYQAYLSDPATLEEVTLAQIKMYTHSLKEA